MSDFGPAAIQAAPAHFDRDAATERAWRLIAEAAAKGASFAAFGKRWLPGYPLFAFAPPTPVHSAAGAAYPGAAVEIPGPETTRLSVAAGKAKIEQPRLFRGKDMTGAGACHLATNLGSI